MPTTVGVEGTLGRTLVVDRTWVEPQLTGVVGTRPKG